MAKSARDHNDGRTVTPDRAARLHRLVTLLGAGPQARDVLRKALGMDVRSFYRDLELLRSCGIDLPLRDRLYVLDIDRKTAYSLLPFPDPHFTLGEATLLARGRSPGHRKLKTLIDQVLAVKAKGKRKKRRG